MRTLNERKICIIEDPQLLSNYGIFRSFPLLFEIIKPEKPVLVSVYDNIEQYMKLPNLEVKYCHYSKLMDVDTDCLFIYSLSHHERTQMIVTRCLMYPCPKIIVVDKSTFKTITGKDLSGVLALIPVKYADIWSNYWRSRSPPIDDTLNFAFHKVAIEVGFYGKLERLFDVNYLHHKGFWQWLSYLFYKLKDEKNWRRLLKFWIENEKTLDNILYNMKMISGFMG